MSGPLLRVEHILSGESQETLPGRVTSLSVKGGQRFRTVEVQALCSETGSDQQTGLTQDGPGGEGRLHGAPGGGSVEAS